MFMTFYDTRRFKYIHDALAEADMFTYSGGEKLPKTATFYGKELNVYIDTSDGVNESLEINEYCGRIIKIVEETKGKPFLFFKSAFSPEWSKNIVRIAEENNGKVVPFFKWPFNHSGFFNYLLPNRADIIKKKNES